MASVIAEVRGFPETLAKLEAASVKMRRVISRRVVVAGARVIAAQARRNAPRRAGVLKRAIFGHFSPRRSRRDQVAVALVRARSGNREGKRRTSKGKTNRDAYYAGWVEFGHRIVQKFKGRYTDYKPRGIGRLTGISKRRRESNSSVPGRPFLATAYKSEGQKAFVEMERVARAGLIESAR